MTLTKYFDPAAIEHKWYQHWEKTGAFRPDRPDAEPFTLVNPPPNVTGKLHIGHALDNSLQDIIVRYERLRGKDALWVVGTDHAGIATQMVVERQLEQQQDRRTNYSREDFIDKIWQWKEQSGGEITGQLRRLGCSMDWDNERFTMDSGFSKAVLKVFIELHKQGLIYRDKRLVNWDPKLKTAISDLEVESRDVQGHMWHFKYPLVDGERYTYIERDEDGQIMLEEERDYIAIATTRPETMLGDGAVAVHPDDPRYAPIVGKFCEIPVGPKAHRRLIPIITDDYPDPDFGSGAVKITGAHDENDYGVAQRNGIPMYRLMDEVAAMRSDEAPYAEMSAKARAIAQGELSLDAVEIDKINLVPDGYRGLDRYEARKAVVADIDAEGLMIAVEDKLITQPFGDRGGVVIEPMLTDQWYVDAKTLAQPAIEAVKTGAIEIVPKSWEKTFFHWMENIQPWCVSRQLWWGHQIPAWYDEAGNHYVAEDEEAAQIMAKASTGKHAELRRDPDVLDTWFSSALWPFATLDWPEQSDKLSRHYPNDLLISGLDILFFWDARMMMQGIHFMKEIPWKRLYLHGLVRAKDGSKMSKSKGNTVDPIGLVEQYGADALRFFMAIMESQGRDIKMDERRIEGYRNFATKLWNAARFCQSQSITASNSLSAPSADLPLNRWIIGETMATAEALERALTDLRFDAAANAIYHFIWDRFCDWYVELSKPVLQGDDPAKADETRQVAGWVLDQILVMLHPFMPFITEELWHAMAAEGTARGYDIIHAHWPQPRFARDPAAEAEMEWLINLISDIRSARAELNIAPSVKMPGHISNCDEMMRARFTRNQALILRLARLESLQDSVLADSARIEIAAGAARLHLPLTGYIDVSAEKARLEKALVSIEKERNSLEGRLNNQNFLAKANPEAVEKARSDLAEKQAEATRLGAALAML